MDILAIFRKASPGRQIALAAVALVVILAALVTLYFTVLRKPYGVLFSDLKPADAATIVEQLDKQKVPYRLADGGATILAPQSIIDVTRLNLMNGDLPLRGTVGFEMFSKSDMGLTEFAQKINYQRALQGELERTIMSLEGIDIARVNLSLSEPNLFQAADRPPKASVTLIMRPGRQASASTVAGIQRLVSAATPDLTVENTVVLDERGGIISGGTSQALMRPAVSADTPQAQAKAAIEQFYISKIRQAVGMAHPDAALTVRVDLPDSLGEPQAYAALQDWSPASRQFPLAIFVGVDRPELLDNAKRLSIAAVGFNPELGDTLASGVQRTASATPPPASQVAADPAPDPDPKGVLPGLLGWAAWAGLGLLLIIAALVAVRRRSRGFPRALTDKEREAYVRRLRALLNSGEADASIS